jgi:hypothetical protein
LSSGWVPMCRWWKRENQTDLHQGLAVVPETVLSNWALVMLNWQRLSCLEMNYGEPVSPPKMIQFALLGPWDSRNLCCANRTASRWVVSSCI